MNVTINIDDFITEEDKIELSKQAFKEAVYKNALENFAEDKRLANKDRMTDYERIISNAVFYYLHGEIDNLIGQDTKALIENGVKNTIAKQDYNYDLFRKKSAWDKENSPAQQVVIDTINQIKPEMQDAIHKKIMENIEAINYDTISELINELICDVIKEKIKA